MKVKYTAYFYPDSEEGTCGVGIPNMRLEFQVTPEKFTVSEMVKEAHEGLSDVLYSYIKDDWIIPDDFDDQPTPGYEFTEALEVDLEELKASRTVVMEMRFDESED